MCHIITIAVREEDFNAARGCVVRGYDFAESANPCVLAALPPAYKTFLLISGWCSCGMYSADRLGNSADPERMRQKYFRRGWSYAKIERAVEQSLAAREQPCFVGFRGDVVDVLREILQKVPRCAVLVHWYRGKVDEEAIEIVSTLETDSASLSDVVPEEDQLLWVSRRIRRRSPFLRRGEVGRRTSNCVVARPPFASHDRTGLRAYNVKYPS